MGIWEWATAVLAIWGAVSILAGVLWVLAGRKIFRPRPKQPTANTDVHHIDRRGGER